MKSLKFLVFNCFLSLMPFTAAAQLSNNNLSFLNEEIDFEYLPYWAVPLSSASQEGGFRPVILASRLVMVRMASVSDEDNSRRYRITDSGRYEYYYKNDSLLSKPKRGFKPITQRTFYLETSRKGLIPKEITYCKFVRMTIDEKQSLLTRQEEAESQKGKYEYDKASLNYQITPSGFQMVIVNEWMHMELTYCPAPCSKEGMAVEVKYLPYYRTPPQLVRLLIDPWNNYKLAGHAYYRNINDVFDDLSAKTAKQ